MELSQVEREWLDYARGVVCNDEHRLACAALGGSPEHPGVDAVDVRWPGYLGRSYKPGGVLCVAMVHRDFASAGVGVAVRDRLVAATRHWKAHQIDDEAYLRAVREVYETGLPKWTVGGNIGAALRHLNIDVKFICYVNAARCQYPEIEPKATPAGAKRTKNALVQLCLSSFPIEQLATRIGASVVLFTNVAAFVRTATQLPKGVLAIAVHQQLARGQAPLVRPLLVRDQTFPVKTRVAVWSPLVLEHLRSHNATVKSTHPVSNPTESPGTKSNETSTVRNAVAKRQAAKGHASALSAT
jgi:hypothetical protein